MDPNKPLTKADCLCQLECVQTEAKHEIGQIRLIRHHIHNFNEQLQNLSCNLTTQSSRLDVRQIKWNHVLIGNFNLSSNLVILWGNIDLLLFRFINNDWHQTSKNPSHCRSIWLECSQQNIVDFGVLFGGQFTQNPNNVVGVRQKNF